MWEPGGPFRRYLWFLCFLKMQESRQSDNQTPDPTRYVVPGGTVADIYIYLYMYSVFSYLYVSSYLCPLFPQTSLSCEGCHWYTAQAQYLFLLIASFQTASMASEDLQLQHLLCDKTMWWCALGPGGLCMHIKAHKKYIYIHCIRCLWEHAAASGLEM